MATQKNTFMENGSLRNLCLISGYPLVRVIWKMLEEEILPDFVEATKVVTSTTYLKSSTGALHLRRSQNVYDVLKYFDDTRCLSKRVATAPANSEDLGIAYSDRAAFLRYRMLYELCLLDANRALTEPLPSSIRQKMLMTKATAWRKIQEQNILRLKMREGILQIKRDNRLGAELNARERLLGYISKVGIDDVDLVVDHSQIDDPIWKITFDNTVAGNVCPKLELKFDARLGPHFVAKADIEPGETLCTDELFSYSLLDHLKLKRCDFCNFQCDALIPCSHCAWDMYCSSACREKAFDTYHRIECHIVPSWSHLDEIKRATRVLLLRTFLRITKQGSELANMMNSPVVCKALDGKLNCANVPFLPENYPILASVVSRLRYSDQKNTTLYPAMTREILAVFASLRSIQFFGNEARGIKSSGNVLNLQEYFGIMLLGNQISLMIPQFFGVEDRVVDSLSDEPLVKRNEFTGVGFSLWKCFTLHSCDPNARKIMNKRRMLVYSVRPIKAGEQISMFGHADFTRHPREKRMDIHKDFRCPECTCRACVENWPTLTELMRRSERYRTNDEMKIRGAEKIRKWLVEQRDFRSIREDHLKTVLPFLRTAREHLEEPSLAIVLGERFVERVMLSKGGVHVDPSL